MTQMKAPESTPAPITPPAKHKLPTDPFDLLYGDSDRDPISEVIAAHVQSIMEELGLNIKDPSLSGTPNRWAKMILSFNTPFSPEDLLERSFQSTDTASIVTQTKIPFAMLCEHHFLPATGFAHIAYLPNKGIVVGLSKLARLVEAVGHERPSLQETINDRVGSLIHNHLNPKGVIVVIQAEHTCMTCRGARAPGVITSTSIVRGAFRDAPAARQEAFSLFDLNFK